MRKIDKRWFMRWVAAPTLLLALAMVGLATEVRAQSSTSTIVASELNPSRAGDAVTFTVRVSGVGGQPTGKVTLTSGDGTALSGALSDGLARFHHTYLAAGFFLVTATYDGDAANLASASAIAQSVRKTPTTTSLGSPPSPSDVGQTAALAATVMASVGAPTRIVAFDIGDRALASTTLAGASATQAGATATQASATAMISHVYTLAGSFTVTAIYHGDGAHLSSVGTVAHDVGKPADATEDSLSNPSDVGQPVVFAASVMAAAGVPMGTLTFDFGDGTSAEATLAASPATVAHAYVSAGNNREPYGDETHVSSAGGRAQTVGKAAATTTVGSLPQRNGGDEDRPSPSSAPAAATIPAGPRS